MNASAVAEQFTGYYYATFDTDRSQLASLYRQSSILTFEGTLTFGAAAIAEKLTSLPFSNVQHKVTTIDAQPSTPSGPNIIVSVTGLLVVDDSPNPLNFSQVFQLVSEGSSYYVSNDIFRLNYG